jgi:hypothetical protein
MSNSVDIDTASATSARRGRFSKLQKQFALVVVLLVVGGYLLTRPQSVGFSSVVRHEGAAQIVWTSYDDEPRFALIYGEPQDVNGNPKYDGVIVWPSESILKLRATDGTTVNISSDASGPITIADREYDLRHGRTFTIDLQNGGAVTQHDVVVPLPPEPAEDRPPYRFDIPNEAVMKFVRTAQETK